VRAAPLRALADGALMARFFGTSTPRVLALHGWGRDGADFTDALHGISAIAPDLPGFGYSPPPVKVWGAADYADQLVQLLPVMDPPVVVVGHSFGGRVAVCLAARYPEQISGLVLSGAPLVGVHKQASPRLSYRLIRWGHRRGLVSDDRMESLRRQSGSSDYRAARGVMRSVLVKVVNESYEDRLPEVACPVRLVWGGADSEVPPEVAHRAGALLKNVDTDVVEGRGHDLPREAPDRIRAAIETLI